MVDGIIIAQTKKIARANLHFWGVIFSLFRLIFMDVNTILGMQKWFFALFCLKIAQKGEINGFYEYFYEYLDTKDSRGQRGKALD
ncbi:MAG: hypothetical protein J6K29_12645 [Clostridia bacterium]|nr:hypothetical protein [Clostridia bacterium]MBP3667883.1 hypothetical protein [Clostridia bacterium]